MKIPFLQRSPFISFLLLVACLVRRKFPVSSHPCKLSRFRMPRVLNSCRLVPEASRQVDGERLVTRSSADNLNSKGAVHYGELRTALAVRYKRGFIASSGFCVPLIVRSPRKGYYVGYVPLKVRVTFNFPSSMNIRLVSPTQRSIERRDRPSDSSTLL